MEMVRHEIHGCPSLFAHWKQEHKVPQSTPKSPLIHISRQPCEQPGVSVNPTARCSGAKGPQDPGWDGWKQRQQGEQEGQQEQAWFEFFWSEFMQTTSYKVLTQIAHGIKLWRRDISNLPKRGALNGPCGGMS